MPVDGRPVPDRRPDVPADQGGTSGRGPDSPAVTAETRTRSEYYAALRAADPDRPRAVVDAGSARSAWETSSVADHPDRPRPESLHIPAERRTHILEGNAGGGGHRHGTGRPGKTEFPASWADEKITESVVSVARVPDLARYQPNGRWLVTGTRDDVRLSAVVLPDGRIWTAYPLPGGPGVTQNPRNP